ncbi:acyl-CoA dehydrogenase [Pseudomonas sp. R5(2019)]|uniref:acyl-CoA dehydrogenase n=1 Tax=Pseudomonas sp. R5(2019) TaxID=2697566 RepID=UPI0014130D1B|nr:acyl-CoA dehydrogenase [Pseudomonas sp. R5(2019)]NBA94696.1 acyl-CoA dehydrogenase [Pseudomonas sp. R5(2019)]
MPWLERLNLRERLTVANSLSDTYAALLEQLGAVTPFELAVLGGRAVTTPGLAFLVGYQAALRALWPSAPASLGALCATEQHSVRPADMRTRLDDLRLTGSKDFVTAGHAAEWLLVAARSEASGAAVQLSLAVVYVGEPGVRLETLPVLPLIPDIGHASVQLDNVLCERLAGDGWDAYVKPFRSLEDLYVLAALSAWLYGVGQECDWPQSLQLRLIGVLAGCAEASRQSVDQPTSHLLLGGLFEQFAQLKQPLDEAFATGPVHWAQLWQRDQDVLEIASAARAKRLEEAWRRVVTRGC